MQEEDFVTLRLTVNGETQRLVVEPRRLLADVLVNCIPSSRPSGRSKEFSAVFAHPVF